MRRVRSREDNGKKRGGGQLLVEPVKEGREGSEAREKRREPLTTMRRVENRERRPSPRRFQTDELVFLPSKPLVV